MDLIFRICWSDYDFQLCLRCGYVFGGYLLPVAPFFGHSLSLSSVFFFGFSPLGWSLGFQSSSWFFSDIQQVEKHQKRVFRKGATVFHWENHRPPERATIWNSWLWQETTCRNSIPLLRTTKFSFTKREKERTATKKMYTHPDHLVLRQWRILLVRCKPGDRNTYIPSFDRTRFAPSRNTYLFNGPDDVTERLKDRRDKIWTRGKGTATGGAAPRKKGKAQKEKNPVRYSVSPASLHTVYPEEGDEGERR